MRILYTFGYFLDDTGGHVVHALGLCRALRRAGHQVRLVAPVHGPDGRTDPWPAWVHPVQRVAGQLGLPRQLAAAVTHELRTWRPEVLYARPALKDLLAMRQAASSGLPLFTEANTLTLPEQMSTGHHLKALAAHQVERWQWRHSRGVVCMTEEIAQVVRASVDGRTNVCVTGNGFDPPACLAAFDPAARRQLDTPDDARVLLFVGSLQPWQGLDRMLRVLGSLDHVYLWVVGSGAEERRWKALAEELGLAARIRWVGWQPGRQLGPYLAAADAALGPLAPDRKRMSEFQPLKVRACLGAGLPVLVCYRDPRLLPDLPWVQSANPRSPDHLRRAAEALLALPTRSADLRRQIRSFARSRLTWDVIAQETIAFIQDCR